MIYSKHLFVHGRCSCGYIQCSLKVLQKLDVKYVINIATELVVYVVAHNVFQSKEITWKCERNDHVHALSLQIKFTNCLN